MNTIEEFELDSDFCMFDFAFGFDELVSDKQTSDEYDSHKEKCTDSKYGS